MICSPPARMWTASPVTVEDNDVIDKRAGEDRGCGKKRKAELSLLVLFKAAEKGLEDLANKGKRQRVDSKESKEKRRPISCKTDYRKAPQKSNSSSKYRGVCWLKKRRSWRARIEVGGRREHLGYFESEETAARAYDVRARQVHGKQAWLNFPEDLEIVEDEESCTDTNTEGEEEYQDEYEAEDQRKDENQSVETEMYEEKEASAISTCNITNDSIDRPCPPVPRAPKISALATPTPTMDTGANNCKQNVLPIGQEPVTTVLQISSNQWVSCFKIGSSWNIINVYNNEQQAKESVQVFLQAFQCAQLYVRAILQLMAITQAPASPPHDQNSHPPNQQERPLHHLQ